MQPIKNQGSCGSCWAFSTVALVEFNHCIATGQAVSLSEQQLVSCDPYDGGCNGGMIDAPLMYIATNGGLDTEASYPYTSGAGASSTCKYNSATVGAKISTTNPITYINDYDTTTMMKIISSKQLVTVAFNVVSSFMSYKSGVYSDSNCADTSTAIIGGHAVSAVGYGTLNGVNYWIIRNSWGTSWGMAGYVLFQRGVNMCGIEEGPVTSSTVS